MSRTRALARRLVETLLAEDGEACPRCGGHGKIHGTSIGDPDFLECPSCHGSGTASGPTAKLDQGAEHDAVEMERHRHYGPHVGGYSIAARRKLGY